MEFSIKSTSPDKHKTACAVLGIYQQRKLTPAARALDQAAGGIVSELLKRGDCDGKPGSTLLVQAPAGAPCERIVLVGLGKEKEVSDNIYCDAVRAALKAIGGTGVREVSSYLAEVQVGQRDLDWKIEQAALVAGETLYRFDQLKSEKDDARPALHKLTLMITAAETKAAEAAVARGQAIVKAMNLAKDLGNLPGNICTPTYLANQAKAVAKANGLKIQVLEQKDLEKLGMGSFLSVAKGSEQPPRFIVMHYHGGAKGERPVVLVGKGITFDSGGISLKPGAEMDEMKYDMCGAASVLGSMQALAELALPLNVVGLIPTCENLPSGRANKPGDIVTSMSGQTIEVLNTDAEGRLILCDALTYAERFDPAAVIDIATLTGACVIALGHVVSGLLANDDDLAREVFQAGESSGDRCWQLPLHDDYQEQLKSNFADMANIGGRPAGTITASAFLSRFAKKYKWAHLDVAGTAWKSGKEKGGTGRPVPLLVHFLAGRVKK